MNRNMLNRINDIQGLLRNLAAPFIRPGDTVIDATAGKGRDTLFLAGLTGENGRVYTFDVQAVALEETRKLLSAAQMLNRVTLIADNHANMAKYMDDKVNAVFFNLGYLPGGDHSIVTLPRSTLTAVHAGLKLLKRSGILVLTVYRGHAGGKEEGIALEKELMALPKQDFSVLKGYYINQEDLSPYWIMVQKHRED